MDPPGPRQQTDQPPAWLWPVANAAGILLGLGGLALGLWYSWDLPPRLAKLGALIAVVCGGGGCLIGLFLGGVRYQILWGRFCFCRDEVAGKVEKRGK